jgi:benzylsuccinate CoA-transferase BbsF subunit
MTQGLPLDDVKVLDFTWVVAAPAAARVLADYGADIVRVETTRRIDTARTFGPFHGGPGPENSILWQSMNTGKLGVTLDLSRKEAKDVVLDLVRWADIVMESFSPRVLPSLGLGYEEFRKVRPDIIMLSTCIMGQTGPLSRFAGYGSLAAALSGFYNVTGWPDRPPAGPYNAYTDTVVPRFILTALLAALDHRRRTGQGQHIDQSHAETTLHFLTPALLDANLNGNAPGRAGNDDARMAPHGVYPAAGDDRWVAIAVQDDPAWHAFCDVIGRSDLAHDERYAGVDGRLRTRRELDDIVSSWTRLRHGQEIEAILQSAGVAASAVQTSYDLIRDPQLLHRNHFVDVGHATLGRITVEGPRFRLSRTPAQVRRAAPTLGQDNQYVLTELLGYPEERIAGLVASGALD